MVITIWLILFTIIQTGNNSNKDGSNPKAESGALIEAAKSKIHQVVYIQRVDMQEEH